MQHSLLVPVANPEVRSSLAQGQLSLSLGLIHIDCDSEQAIVWALYDGGVSNLQQIVFQYRTIQKSYSFAEATERVSEVTRHFNNKGLSP